MPDFLDPLIEPGFKGFPTHVPAIRRSRIGAQGWNVRDGDLPFPVAVLRRGALEHNLAWMRDYARSQGVGLAPHGKTTMAPELFRRQLAAGAWGLTFAHVTQLPAGLAAGATRLLIANQVMAAGDLAAIAALTSTATAPRILFLLDSLEQLALIEATAPSRPFEILLELGIPGGRTGCRDAGQALALARRARASAAVVLAGIECYEGLGNTGDTALDRPAAESLMDRVESLALQCDTEDLFETDEVILSAGGSGVFDLVAPRLRPRLRRPVLGLLRSGCYIVHDHGQYRRLVRAVDQRLGCAPGQGLQAALEVWSIVQSLPEPGLAILGAGKRDVSCDLGLPVPLAVQAAGRRELRPAPEDWTVFQLNDQHAYLRLGADAKLAVGDRVVLGISHPCTTFDKWRWMPVVDEDHRVVDAIVTWF